jgi:nicotinamidase-related amidase
MRLHASTSALCVIDVQERLVPAMAEGERVVARCRRLSEAARLVNVPTILTEQYPKGLGSTIATLAEILPPPLTKMSFSCCGGADFSAAIPAGVSAMVLCGLETHVCVAQTALDLLAAGTAVFIAVDAVTSRHPIDHETALRRLEAAGAIVTTSEAILFEWCGTAEHPQFQAIRRLVLA